MDEAVEVIAFEAEQLVQRSTGERREPSVIGDLRVGVVGPDLMEAQKYEYQRVRNARQLEPPIGRHESDDGDDHERVLECPVGAVEGLDREHYPLDRKHDGENSEITVTSRRHAAPECARRTTAASLARCETRACPTPRVHIVRPTAVISRRPDRTCRKSRTDPPTPGYRHARADSDRGA